MLWDALFKVDGLLRAYNCACIAHRIMTQRRGDFMNHDMIWRSDKVKYELGTLHLKQNIKKLKKTPVAHFRTDLNCRVHNRDDNGTEGMVPR
jgi:hypothetical protein